MAAALPLTAAAQCLVAMMQQHRVRSVSPVSDSRAQHIPLNINATHQQDIASVPLRACVDYMNDVLCTHPTTARYEKLALCSTAYRKRTCCSCSSASTTNIAEVAVTQYYRKSAHFDMQVNQCL
eukprot:13529-Heterococcus_DN1.PRE.7